MASMARVKNLSYRRDCLCLFFSFKFANCYALSFSSVGFEEDQRSYVLSQFREQMPSLYCEYLPFANEKPTSGKERSIFRIPNWAFS